MRLVLTMGIISLIGFSGLAAAGGEDPRFAVYRVDLVENESAPTLDRNIKDIRYFNSYVTQEYVLATAVRHEPPILTESDIVEYCWATQRIQLTDEGALSWDSQGGFQVPLNGLPLLVVVDGEPRYGAMLWNPASSLSCKLPQIWCKTLDNRLIMGGRYITAEGDTVYRENFDPQVMQVMDELGKLANNCEEN